VAEFITPGLLGRRALDPTGEARARRIFERATTAMRLARPQPFSTLAEPIPTSGALAWLLSRAGVPRPQAAELLRVSGVGMARSLAMVREARADPPVAAWLDELASAMPSFRESGDAT
jgi:hypothetical protein